MDTKKLEKIVSAAFIGAGLGAPASVHYDDAERIITVHCQELPENALPPMPDENIRMVQAAARALYENSGVSVQPQEGANMGMLIRFQLGNNSEKLLDVSPKDAISSAIRHVRDRSDGGGKSGQISL